MLREYAPNELLMNEVKRINWFLDKVNKDKSWPLGQYQIPVELSENSRFEWGALPAANDIPLAQYAKPYVSAPKQLLGSMIFDQMDLLRHQGDVKKSFLSILPQKVNQFTKRMSEKINLSLLGDGSICPLTANGTVGGLVTVGKTKVTLFTEREKIQIKDADSVAVAGYVRGIDVNAGTFSLYNAATGGAVVDLSAYTTVQAAKVYVVDAMNSGPTSLVQICFSAANGGADSLYGGAMVKSASPVFQPYFADLSAATTGATFLAALYDAFYEAEEMGRGGIMKEVLVPYQAFKSIAKATETFRKFEMGKTETTFGSSTVELTGPHGSLKVRSARGIPSDKAFLIDYDAITIASRGELIKKANPMSPLEAFEIRNTTGYQYIVDKMAEFELIVKAPANMGGLKIASAIA
jgi:hypothetical protein